MLEGRKESNLKSHIDKYNKRCIIIYGYFLPIGEGATYDERIEVSQDWRSCRDRSANHRQAVGELHRRRTVHSRGEEPDDERRDGRATGESSPVRTSRGLPVHVHDLRERRDFDPLGQARSEHLRGVRGERSAKVPDETNTDHPLPPDRRRTRNLERGSHDLRALELHTHREDREAQASRVSRFSVFNILVRGGGRRRRES